jgi:hypothetical protein
MGVYVPNFNTMELAIFLKKNKSVIFNIVSCKIMFNFSTKKNKNLRFYG